MAVIDSRTNGPLSVLEQAGTDNPEIAVRLWLSALTGIPKERVRPRWSPRPGTRPPLDADWCAVGIMAVKTLGTPYQHGKKGELEKPESGDVTRESHQRMDFAVSFYGPNAALLADTFRESSQISQNAEALKAKGMSLLAVSADIQRMPDFVFETWVDRYEVTFQVGRKVTRTYGVRSIAGFSGNEILHD